MKPPASKTNFNNKELPWLPLLSKEFLPATAESLEFERNALGRACRRWLPPPQLQKNGIRLSPLLFPRPLRSIARTYGLLPHEFCVPIKPEQRQIGI
jgi:hypothetical protein